jgi:hypothetical protein
MADPIGVVLEVAAKRSFASALDWPGWSRSGKSPDEAVDALIAYGPRYARVASRAGAGFHAPDSRDEVTVVERMRGGSGTEFGAPGSAASAEEELPTAAEMERLLGLLQAAWATFDAAAVAAEGVSLATGPRGGGRSRSAIVDHVREADVAYLSKLGSRSPAAANEDLASPMAHLRGAFVDALAAVAAGQPVANPSRTQNLWSVRYTIRRSAWHALDHAWELEDRAAR